MNSYNIKSNKKSHGYQWKLPETVMVSTFKSSWENASFYVSII